MNNFTVNGWYAQRENSLLAGNDADCAFCMNGAAGEADWNPPNGSGEDSDCAVELEDAKKSTFCAGRATGLEAWGGDEDEKRSKKSDELDTGAVVVRLTVLVDVAVDVVVESVLPKFAAAPRSMVLEGLDSVRLALETVKESSLTSSLSFSSEASSPSSPLLKMHQCINIDLYSPNRINIKPTDS